MVSRIGIQPRKGYTTKAGRLLLVGVVCSLLFAGGTCSEEPAEPTATMVLGVGLDPAGTQRIDGSTMQTFEARSPDYRKNLTLSEAAVVLGWEPLKPDPRKYQPTTERVNLESFLGDGGDVLVVDYSAPSGVVFRLRQAHHPFRSIPNRPADYIHHEVGSFLLDEWADQYQSFAEVTGSELTPWRGFVDVDTPNLTELEDFVGSLR